MNFEVIKMIKKLIALLLCIFMLVACCGCSLMDYFLDDSDDRDSSSDARRDEDEDEEDRKEYMPSADSDNVETETVEATEATEAKPACQILLDQYTATVKAGKTLQLKASSDEVLTFQWRSSDESVALVNSRGIVTGVKAGVANITCYADGALEASCTVTVTGSQSTTTYPTSPSVWPTSSDFIFPHSSTAYLTEEEISQKLSTMTGPSPGKSYAQDAINEIYARNGYVFQIAETRAYYESKTWYYPDSSFTTSRLNKYEQYNIALLEKF